MSLMLIAILAGSAVLVLASAVLLMGEVRRDEHVAARVEIIRSGYEPEEAVAVAQDSAILRVVSDIGKYLARSGFLSVGTVKGFHKTLDASGVRSKSGLYLFIGFKLLTLFVAPLAAWCLLDFGNYTGKSLALGVSAAAVIGLLAPDWYVKAKRRRHLKQVEQGLPDALDMMVICAEAGLALEATITRVGREIEPAHPAVSREYLQTADELRVVADHRAVMAQMGMRIGVEGIKRLTTTLTQALQYGTPLAEALKILSAELRREMLTRFEARAARLPVLLTIPMILFILPCVFMVVGGPAVLQIMQMFKS